MYNALAQRFWSNVDIKGPDDCWEWLGEKDKNGYGRFLINGKMCLAPRIAYILANNLTFPKDMCRGCGDKRLCDSGYPAESPQLKKGT